MHTICLDTAQFRDELNPRETTFIEAGFDESPQNEAVFNHEEKPNQERHAQVVLSAR